MNSIRVKNFKSVIDSGKFQLRPLTLLAGINSSGKTSLLQALLLLKQSINAGSKILLTNGPYLTSNEPLELVRGKKRNNTINISLTLDADSFLNPRVYEQFINEENHGLASVELQIDVVANGTTVLHNLSCLFRYKQTEETASVLVKRKKTGLYTISFSSPQMVGLDDDEKIKKMDNCALTFHSFLPIFAEWERNGKPDTRALYVMKNLESDLDKFFSSLFYMGPQRVKPVLARGYSQTTFADVGIDGQYTRFLYEENKNKEISGYEKGETLQILCNRWICQKMELARSIDVQRDSNKLYRTIITNNDGLSVDLCQMGFGLSQILPIVVQGFLLHAGDTLIVEDPDVHMHPRIQALLVDFFIDLLKHGRNIVIETHSDHIVTRLRRRISDGTISKDEVNLSFVENEQEGSVYRFIDLEEDGSFADSLPKGFLDVQEEDFMAIIDQRNH